MKKTLSAAIATLFLISQSYLSFAQAEGHLAFAEPKRNANHSVFTPTAVYASHSEINESKIALKANKDFNKSFRNVTTVSWYAVAGGMVATFEKQGEKVVVTYDKKGRWMHDIHTYAEQNLAPDIRQMIRSTYLDYRITLVNEIDVADKKVFIVHLNSKGSWINLSVLDGEMLEIAKYSQPESDLK